MLVQEQWRDRHRNALRAFCQSLSSGDLKQFAAAWKEVGLTCNHAKAFRIIRRAKDIPEDIRFQLMIMWGDHGDHLRGEIGNDFLVIDVLRKIGVPYLGGYVELYRGDSAHNRSRRTLGMSWTTDIEVARSFANSEHRLTEGGSVLLRTVAPKRAIVCDIGELEGFEENEYIVDRRQLSTVEVVERFSQWSHQGYGEHCEREYAELVEAENS